MTALLRRVFRKTPRLPHWCVTLYTRQDCCCCQKARQVLDAYRRRYRFALEQVDIDRDPELRARFDTSVPVVAVNGKVRFKGVVNRVLLDRLITAELAGEK
jgi:glutaredoxin